MDGGFFRLEIKPVSRGDGRSAVAAAAYSSGCRLTDERTGRVHDYRRKGGVLREASIIVGPVGVSQGLLDRAFLWNEAERCESRKDARVARSLLLSLPHELSLAAQERLVTLIARVIAWRYRVVVDATIHLPPSGGPDDRNHHAHFVVTTRKVGKGGKTAFGEKSEMELSDTERRRRGLGPMAAEIVRIRRFAAAAVNQALNRADITARVDHRSHAKRRHDILPLQTLSYRDWKRERNAAGAALPPVTRFGRINAEIRTHNQDVQRRDTLLEAHRVAQRLYRRERILAGSQHVIVPARRTRPSEAVEAVEAEPSSIVQPIPRATNNGFRQLPRRLPIFDRDRVAVRDCLVKAILDARASPKAGTHSAMAGENASTPPVTADPSVEQTRIKEGLRALIARELSTDQVSGPVRLLAKVGELLSASQPSSNIWRLLSMVARDRDRRPGSRNGYIDVAVDVDELVRTLAEKSVDASAEQTMVALLQSALRESAERERTPRPGPQSGAASAPEQPRNLHSIGSAKVEPAKDMNQSDSASRAL